MMKTLPVGLFALALVAVVFASVTGSTTADADTPFGFGMGSSSIASQTQAGVKPDYGTFWIGPWTLTSGWGGPDKELESMKTAGITPAVHFYYWGDDISQDCLENGCWSSLHNTHKDHAGWNTLAQQLADHLNAKMAGRPVIIMLETEFNKRGVATYEPLDGYLAEKANFFHTQYPAGKVVMALGNWNSPAWTTWDRTAAASDYIGIQGLRSTAHHTLSQYMTLYETTLDGAKTAQSMFGKPILIQDIALSSYPEPDYLDHQAAALDKFFTGLPALKEAGVMGILYRSWADNPKFDLANYHGEAERHWGLAWTTTGPQKPSGEVWVAGVKAARAGTPTPTPLPEPTPIAVGKAGAVTEAETFATKTAGGLQSDSAASGGKSWNLWSNGSLQQSYDIAPGEYDITIRARGTWANGVAPHLLATLAGAPLLSADPGTTYADFTARVDVVGGAADLRLTFANDGRTATEDRNLILDRVSFVALGTAPVADFTVTVLDLEIFVDASRSSDADGDSLTYAWAFGDQATGTGKVASHAYAASGTYAVTLSVSDGQRSATATRTITVTAPNQAPTAAFTAAMNRLSVTVDASDSSDPDGDVLTHAWNFGDGSTGSGATATHAYAAAGTYTVRLTVNDGQASGSATKSVAATKPFSASFAPSSNVNEWWVEVKVTSSEAPAKVQAKVNAGSWIDLPKTDWGAWAKSLNAPKGSSVTFRATSASGETVTSAPFTWLAKAMSATFTPKSVGNDWWIETKVTASETVAKVQVRLNGGSWTDLPKTDWGAWAKSMKVPDGTKVEFRATGSSGATATSSVYVWN